MIPLSICAFTVSGLTIVPQSTAQTTRCTRTSPSSRPDASGNFGDVRLAERVQERNALTAATAAASPAGLLRGELEDRPGARRLVEQSPAVLERICFAATASSSMKLSTTKMLCVGPTPRQNAVGIPGGSWRTYSTRMLGNA